MCDCAGTGKCESQVKELNRFKVRIKTLQRTTKNGNKRKEYREKYISVESLISYYTTSEDCPSGREIEGIRNYIRNEQAKSNK